MTDPDDLPYAENGGFAPVSFKILCALAFVVLLALRLTGFYAATVTEIMTPLVIIGTLYLGHYAVRNAVHEGARLNAADQALDDMLMAQVNREAKRTLTPISLARSLDEVTS